MGVLAANPKWIRGRKTTPVVLALLLLAIAAIRILRLQDMSLSSDESWFIYIGFGSWLDILRWTDASWPPLSHLLLDIWVELVGVQPYPLRYFYVLYFLVGSAFFYRVLQKEAGAAAARLSLLAYSGVWFTLYYSIELRGYALMLALLPITWFFAQRLRAKASVGSAIQFALVAAIALYASYFSVFPLIMFFLYVIWVEPSRLQRNIKYLILAAALTLVLASPLVVYLPRLLELRGLVEYKRLIFEPWLLAEAKIYCEWIAFGDSWRRNGSWLYLLLLASGVGGVALGGDFSAWPHFCFSGASLPCRCFTCSIRLRIFAW